MNQQYPHDPSQPFAPQQPFPAQHQAPKKNHRVRNVIGGVAAGLVTLIFIIGFFADDSSTSEASTTPLPNVVTTTTPAPVKSTPAPAETTPVPKATKTTKAAPVVTPKPKPVVYKKLTTREWAKIAKTPDSHIGETITVYGVVTQFDAATGVDGFLASVDGKRHAESYDYDTNTVFQQVAGDSKLDDLVEDDMFVARVKVTGSYSYDTQIGGNTTVPALEVVSVTVIGGNS